MKLEGYGIVLSAYKYGDNGIIVKILSREHGPIKGMIKGQRRNSQIIQPGNFVHFSWNARLADHLGMISATLEKAYALLNFSEYHKILSISSLCSMIDALVAERDDAADIFDGFKQYLDGISADNWLQQHVLLELFILEKTGFGIDIGKCSVTGSIDNITYISPKTGSAVSKDVGEPYRSRLFSIPGYFFQTAENLPASMQEIVDGLEITRYFLAKHFFAESLAKIPSACIQFRDEIIRATDLNDQTRQDRNYQF